jgi:hypothetical protein
MQYGDWRCVFLGVLSAIFVDFSYREIALCWKRNLVYKEFYLLSIFNN